MPGLKLNRRSVAALLGGEKPDKTTFYYDVDLRGFGLRLTPAGTASWIVEYRTGAGGRTAPKKRVTLGGVDKLSPEDARDAAAKTLARAKLGADPAKAKADERASVSVRKLVDDYVSQHVDAKRKATTAASRRA